jgi:hypothetical protein
MNFNLSSEHQMVQKMFKTLLRKELNQVQLSVMKKKNFLVSFIKKWLD